MQVPWQTEKPRDNPKDNLLVYSSRILMVLDYFSSLSHTYFLIESQKESF
jgi:hypothetical protein